MSSVHDTREDSCLLPLVVPHIGHTVALSKPRAQFIPQHTIVVNVADAFRSNSPASLPIVDVL